MRFNTVEVGHAYSDYLDSLEDWPPPEQAPPTSSGMEGNADLDAQASQGHVYLQHSVHHH